MERPGAWRLINVAEHTPYYNMALDEAVFLLADHTAPSLRFYTWNPPAVSIGYFQKAGSVKKIIPEGVCLVRRPTGGEAVFHVGDISYSLIFSPSSKDTLGQLNEALARGIGKGFNVAAKLRGFSERGSGLLCFGSSSKYDIIIDEEKIGGASFKKSRGFILQQGFISLKKNLLSGVSLSSLLGKEVSSAEAVRAMVEGIQEEISLEEMPLRREELELAERLVGEKYKNLVWTERR